MKKKKPRFSAVKEVKAMSREKFGVVPAKKVIPDPRLKPEKYPKQALESEES
jgi:hypothetical protein